MRKGVCLTCHPNLVCGGDYTFLNYFFQHIFTAVEHILCARSVLDTEDIDLFDSFHKCLLSTYYVPCRD